MIGEVVVTKNAAGQIVAVTRQDEEGQILSVIAESAPASCLHQIQEPAVNQQLTTEQEPVFWYRPVCDGEMYEGPHHNNSTLGKMLREEKPGEWKPLYAAPVLAAPAAVAVPDERAALKKIIDACEQIPEGLEGYLEPLSNAIAEARAALAATPADHAEQALGMVDADPAADAPVNAWQQAVDKELVSAHLGVAGDVTPAEAAKALHELICWNIEVATNPQTNGGKVLVPAAAPVVGPEKSASFEAWAKTEGGPFALHNCGPYNRDAMKLAGMAWHASALLATATGLPAQAVDAVDPVQAAADAASVGHLSHLIDHQSQILARAMAAMKAVESTAAPIDESHGDLDARIPYEAWATFVDARAALLHDVAQSPVAAPQAQKGQP